MGDVGHRCVEAVDGLIVEGEWSSIKAVSTAEGIEDAVAVVDGNRNGVAIAVGCDVAAAIGFAVVHSALNVLIPPGTTCGEPTVPSGSTSAS